MFPTRYVLEQVLLTSEEMLVRELPPVGIHFPEPVGVELTNEAAEVVVFEISRQDALREVERVSDDEAVVGRSPGDEPIGRRIVDHLICFGNEWCDHVCVRARSVIVFVLLHFFSLFLFLLYVYMVAVGNEIKEAELVGLSK